MKLYSFCKQIGLSSHLTKIICQYEIENDTKKHLLFLLNTNRQKFFTLIKKQRDEHLAALIIFTNLAAFLHTEFHRRGISDKIYFDTFSDIRIWSDEYFKKCQKPGLLDYEWVSYSLELRLFRLGRLQFEPSYTKELIKTDRGILPVGTPVLSIHIPSGEPITSELCDQSFKMAAQFFKDPFEGYLCDSWLLSPVLREFLPSDSNIILFQDRFTIYKVVHSFRQAEERVFGEILDDVSCYPENTSLQRSLKNYLISGKEPGIGFGVILNKKDHLSIG